MYRATVIYVINGVTQSAIWDASAIMVDHHDGMTQLKFPNVDGRLAHSSVSYSNRVTQARAHVLLGAQTIVVEAVDA